MRWDAASFELGAPWHMTPDGVWHEGPSSAPRVVTGHVVKVDPWGVTIAEGAPPPPPPPAVIWAPAGANRAPNRRERRAARAR